MRSTRRNMRKAEGKPYEYNAMVVVTDEGNKRQKKDKKKDKRKKRKKEKKDTAQCVLSCIQ